MVLNRLGKGIILVSLLMVLLRGTSDAQVQRNQIRMDILPCSDVVMSFKKFHPLISYLKQQTGFEIETVVPKDFEELEWALKNGDIDFALQDPHTYVSLAKSYNRDALLRTLTREGKTSQYGLIIARKGSGINYVHDLRGKTVMFGPKLSSSKWIAAREIFRENGINIDKDLKAYSNGGCCEDIAFNVYLKAVDAGVVCDHFIEEHSDRQRELGINVKELTVIGRTKPVSTKIFAARKEINIGVVTKINQILLSLDRKNHAHAEILYPAELGGFQKVRDEEYDGIRGVMGVKR
jgi:phosphonate transport system substrate-binding protein